MKKAALVPMFFIAAACFGQNQEPLCPRHIESPDYPALARTAHVSGTITLTVTIDADGTVRHVEATGGLPAEQKHPLLRKYAAENMQRWTFTKPPTAPFTQIIVYDFELDETLPGSGGLHSAPWLTKVRFDLPDRVTISTNLPFVTEFDQTRARVGPDTYFISFRERSRYPAGGMQSKVTNAGGYIAEAPLGRQAALKRLRSLCRETLTGYREEIDYGMPVYKRKGVMEVAFASQKHYISLYILKKEVVDAHRAVLKNCSVGKGCIRFKHPEQIDFEVVKSLLRATFESDTKPC